MKPWHGIIPPPPGYNDVTYGQSSIPIDYGKPEVIHQLMNQNRMDKLKDSSFHPFDTTNCKKRLIEEYETHGNLVVGFDFDNTIFDCHGTGGNYGNVLNLLRRCKALGFTLCLYTAELRPEWLEWKIKYCQHYGIKPDYVNSSPLLMGTEKPFFSILLDDRAGLESAYYTLKEVVEYAERAEEDESL